MALMKGDLPIRAYFDKFKCITSYVDAYIEREILSAMSIYGEFFSHNKNIRYQSILW